MTGGGARGPTPTPVNQTLHYPGAAGGRQTQPIRGLDTALCPHGEKHTGAGGAPLPEASRPCSSGPDSTRLWLSRAQVTPRGGAQRNDTRLAVRERPEERERGLPAPRPSLRAGGHGARRAARQVAASWTCSGWTRRRAATPKSQLARQRTKADSHARSKAVLGAARELAPAHPPYAPAALPLGS